MKPNYTGFPLAEIYFNAMLNKGHTEGSADYYARQVKKVERFMADNGLETYTEQTGSSFLSWWTKTQNPSREFQDRVSVVVQRLNQMAAGEEISFTKPRKEAVSPPECIRNGIESYCQFQAGHCGLKDSTLKYHIHTLERFFQESGVTDFSGITLPLIEKGFRQSTHKRAYRTVIRKFMLFLYQKGYIQTDLSGRITQVLPSVPNSHPLPSVYSDDEIALLLNAVDRGTMKGCRDFAILTLAARLGLRASDICGMTLGEVDFDHDEIRIVQKKTSVPLKLPLLPEVRDALSAYIDSRCRTDPDDVIFRQCRAPHKELTHVGLWCIMRKYLKASGVEPGRRRRGTHALRSSLASSMVAEDVPYHAVQKVLGHESPQAAKSYIRIDLAGLRKFTIPVPGASGVFAKCLEGGGEQ
ncbi:MAG: tyrosine-type recombinase/integrase [Blautia sp.]|nr:tyrosine-type recombinase/integrase [Blautia sp.]